ncbi:hypothetical protein ACLKA6_008838 [Drosophila palustris]
MALAAVNSTLDLAHCLPNGPVTWYFPSALRSPFYPSVNYSNSLCLSCAVSAQSSGCSSSSAGWHPGTQH